jgi:hypothetical protein
MRLPDPGRHDTAVSSHQAQRQLSGAAVTTATITHQTATPAAAAPNAAAMPVDTVALLHSGTREYLSFKLGAE